jgi:hypothetical protein
MYQNGCGCNLNGLGVVGWDDAAIAAYGIYQANQAKKSGGAGGSGASGGDASGGGTAPNVTQVSPTIQTQISPQISPVFQQQFQPTNSAATAGTSQMVPAMPGNDGSAGQPLPPGYASPTTVPVPSVPVDYMRYAPYALGAVALVVALKIFTRKKGTK